MNEAALKSYFMLLLSLLVKEGICKLWSEMATYLLLFPSLLETLFSDLSCVVTLHGYTGLCPKLRCSNTMLIIQWHQSNETGMFTGIPEVWPALCVGLVSRLPSMQSNVCSGVL